MVYIWCNVWCVCVGREEETRSPTGARFAPPLSYLPNFSVLADVSSLPSPTPSICRQCSWLASSSILNSMCKYARIHSHDDVTPRFSPVATTTTTTTTITTTTTAISSCVPWLGATLRAKFQTSSVRQRWIVKLEVAVGARRRARQRSPNETGGGEQRRRRHSRNV